MAMTAMHAMPAAEAKEAIGFWVAALRPYRPEQIAEAFTHFARTSGGKYPNPQSIIAVIEELDTGVSAEVREALEKAARSYIPAVREHAERMLARLNERGQ